MSTLVEAILRDAFADRPAAGSAGRLFYATDTGATYRDSGTAWESYSGTGAVTSVAGRTGAVVLASSDISGLAASATTDTTDAANISSGTLNAARLPAIPESAVTNLISDLAAKAPLASPALTGTPTAPTQTAADNSTKLATTAYVDSAVSTVGGGTVTSVSATVPSDFSVVVTNPTTTPAIAITGGPTKSGIQQQAYTYAADSGTANAYAVTLSPAPTIIAGSEVVFKAANANTGASTLAVNGATAVSITKNGVTSALASGDIAAGQIITARYDGSVFQITAPGSAAGGGSWSGLTDPSGNLALTMGANTSTLTYNAATGSNDLFKLADTTSNTGTGALLSIFQASSSAATGLRVKIGNNSGTTAPSIQVENSGAAVKLGLYVSDVGGVGTNRIDATGGPFMVTRGGNATTNQIIYFDGATTLKWLGTIKANFDGVTSSEVGITVTNKQTMSTSSTAALLSVQNNGGTRLFDVSPFITTVKSGKFAIATSQTPSSATDTGTAGQIAWDANFLYVCVATNSWKRIGIATW